MKTKRINILGIDLDNYKRKEIWQILEKFLNGEDTKIITTVNPEFLLNAMKDEEFFYILEHSDLSIPDGSGLWFAGITMLKHVHRYPGADLSNDLLDFAHNKHLKIAIFNWQKGLSQRYQISKTLEEKFPGLEVLVLDTNRKSDDFNYPEIKEFKPDIVFASLGSPYQEKFIFHNRNELKSARILIGVGGTFDFLTGRIKRAPKIMRSLGIEWLWRIFSQPQNRLKRLKRIYQAVIVFPAKFIKWRFIHPWFYRPNVAALVYKKVGDEYNILLVERQGDPGHWQIPQGGTDDMGLRAAGLKELHEELGTNKLKAIKEFKNVYKFKFGDRGEPKERIKRALRHTGYKGQKQGLLIAKFTGSDSDIKINYWDHDKWKWVAANNAINEVHDIRKPGMKKFLELFNKTINI